MKISCLPVSIFKDICSDRMDLVDWAGVAKEIGYDGIDISIMFLKNRTPTYLAKLRQGLADVGLPVIMMRLIRILPIQTLFSGSESFIPSERCGAVL